jgi:hypothetical protein
MKTLIRIAKWVGVLITAAILFFIIVINFGKVESRLECSGQVLRKTESGQQVNTQATLYAKVETFRWWVVWAEHDAWITWEIQPSHRSGFGFYNHNDFGTPIEGGSGHYQGYFSPLSNRIQIYDSYGSGTFDGRCQ